MEDDDKETSHVEDAEEQLDQEIARWLAGKDAVARLIDELPHPTAIKLLRAWRRLNFGEPGPEC
jgi:hypothetical protein